MNYYERLAVQLKQLHEDGRIDLQRYEMARRLIGLLHDGETGESAIPIVAFGPESDRRGRIQDRFRVALGTGGGSVSLFWLTCWHAYDASVTMDLTGIEEIDEAIRFLKCVQTVMNETEEAAA